MLAPNYWGMLTEVNKKAQQAHTQPAALFYGMLFRSMNTLFRINFPWFWLEIVSPLPLYWKSY